MCMENKKIFKEFLQSKGIKQRWLADELGVSEITISNWANGTHYPQVKYIEHMQKMFRRDSEIHFLGKKGK